jgi:TM2 domain-containing membrane protein YozV
MNCAQHPETPATAFCRECGKPMCPDCQRPALGSVYCDVHLPAPAPAAAPPTASGFAPAAPYTSATYATPPASSPYTAPAGAPYVTQTSPDNSVHPVLALLLGLIPGVGAIYNGQYAKGLVHTIVFGLLVSTLINSHNDGMIALLGIMIAAWVFYMAFEAYHTARKRRYGATVEEFSSQFDFRAGGGRFPAGAILMIGLGFILLLETTDIISIDDLGKYWPIGLIVLGVWLLYNRLNPEHRPDHRNKDAEVRR